MFKYSIVPFHFTTSTGISQVGHEGVGRPLIFVPSIGIQMYTTSIHTGVIC